ncbi:MAG: molybdate ABC transporter substrate-binding protein [Ginsengibacter sp.]
MKALITAFFILFFSFHSRESFAQQKITVAVAANMQYAFSELKIEFQKTTNIHVDEVIGASGNLTRQIIQGAPFDVFISADTKYPDALYNAKKTAGKPKVYARGVLVLLTAKSGINLSPQLNFLSSNKIKSIAIANPRIAPYGSAAVALLKKHDLFKGVSNKLVMGESISQTSQFIASGNADVGFTAKAVVLSETMKNKGKWIELNTNDYPPILQSAVVLKYGAQHHAEASKSFFEFLFSKKALEIYKKYGYIN